jgi:hypothetical protein
MQVNLMHHPQAFQSLDMAFEPAVNADYAARFLLQLHDQSGDWTKATASYHSGNPAEGDPYAAKVTSIWPEEQRKAGLAPSMLPSMPPFPAGRAGRFASVTPMLPGRQPPRMLPLPGMIQGEASGMLPLGMRQAETTIGGMAQPGLIAPRSMQPGTTSPGGTFAQNVMSPGRGLAFYRAMPIRVMQPIRVAAQQPDRVFMR